jgi:hypothetical protein
MWLDQCGLFFGSDDSIGLREGALAHGVCLYFVGAAAGVMHRIGFMVFGQTRP